MDNQDSTTTNQDKERLEEMILDHLGLPRPGTSAYVQEIQDKLLPGFIEASRNAWMAASPMIKPNQTIYSNLSDSAESVSEQFEQLNVILGEMGVTELLQDMAASPLANLLAKIPIDSYESRILRAAGHPNPERVVGELLRRAAKNPTLMSSPSITLDKAAKCSMDVHTEINFNQLKPKPPSAKPTPKKSRKSALLNRVKGAGKLFSGTALLAGNALMIPNVSFTTVLAIPVLGSLASGITYVVDGVQDIAGTNEPPN